ncbi:MAG: hypothetical protein ACRD2L_10880 [Terriglobia bacterium]
MYPELTPEEEQIVQAVSQHLNEAGMRAKVLVPVHDDAPYRTSLVATRSNFSILVEAQAALHYHSEIKKLAGWMASNRFYGELYVALPDSGSTALGMLQEMRRDGVGLFSVDERGRVELVHPARNPALVINPDPTLTFGTYRNQVLAAIRKFNESTCENRKDGLRDMCELVEGLTRRVGETAIRKGVLNVSQQDFLGKTWHGQITTLGDAQHHTPRKPVFNTPFSNDMHSFRGARNLIDHPVKGKRDEIKRQKQFAERMMQGPRLVAELVTLKRKIR